MAEPREHIRCPACGKLSDEARFHGKPSDEGARAHDLEVMVQSFIGAGNKGWREGDTKQERREERKKERKKGGGFEWSSRTLSDRELALLGDAMRRGLDAIVKAQGGTPQTREAELEAELARSKRRNAQLRKTLRLAVIELRNR